MTTNPSVTTVTNTQPPNTNIPRSNPGLFEQARKLGISQKAVIYSGIFMLALLLFTVMAILQKRSPSQNTSTSPSGPVPTRPYIPNRTSPWYEVLPGDTMEGIALSHGYHDTTDASAGQQLWSVGGNRLSIPNYHSNLHKGELIQLW